MILEKPFFDDRDAKAMSWKDTSSSPQVCERIAYGGITEAEKSCSSSVVVLMSLMVAAERGDKSGDGWVAQLYGGWTAATQIRRRLR